MWASNTSSPLILSQQSEILLLIAVLRMREIYVLVLFTHLKYLEVNNVLFPSMFILWRGELGETGGTER